MERALLDILTVSIECGDIGGCDIQKRLRMAS